LGFAGFKDIYGNCERNVILIVKDKIEIH